MFEARLWSDQRLFDFWASAQTGLSFSNMWIRSRGLQDQIFGWRMLGWNSMSHPSWGCSDVQRVSRNGDLQTHCLPQQDDRHWTETSSRKHGVLTRTGCSALHLCTTTYNFGSLTASRVSTLKLPGTVMYCSTDILPGYPSQWHRIVRSDIFCG